MIDNYIYMIMINGNLYPEYGYFENFDLAKAKAAEIAAEYGEAKFNEESWKAHRMFVDVEHERVIGVEKIDHYTCAEY